MSTWKWLSGILGILLSVGVVISLIEHNTAIDLQGIPAKVFAQYAWLRDKLFHPVAWVLRYFSIEISTTTKDLLLGYSLLVAATARAHDYWVARGLETDSWKLRLAAAWLWPLTVLSFTAQNSMDRANIARGTHKGTFTLDGLPYDEAYIAIFKRNIQKRSHMLAAIGWNLLKVACLTLLFFVWSYLSNAYGPPA